jgi:hypothetical protein
MMVIDITNQIRHGYAIKQVSNLPFDGSMEIVIRPITKKRTSSQNNAMWGVRLAEIADGVWVNGHQFSGDAWHIHLKREYLPEGHEEDFEKLVTKPETYAKWSFLPDGSRECIGSTTQLTTYGWQWYWTRIEAFFALQHGLHFKEFVRAS